MYIKRIKDLRENRNLKQEEISKILNVTQATYSRYESEVLGIPTDILIKLALFYNVSTDYILGLTNIKEPYHKNKKDTN